LPVRKEKVPNRCREEGGISGCVGAGFTAKKACQTVWEEGKKNIVERNSTPVVRYIIE